MAKPKKRKHRKLDRSLPVMRPNAGGIDIGATEIFVAVPADRDTDSVRSFPTFTQDLHALGRLAAAMPRRYRGHGIHRRLLDTAVSDPGSSRH